MEQSSWGAFDMQHMLPAAAAASSGGCCMQNECAASSWDVVPAPPPPCKPPCRGNCFCCYQIKSTPCPSKRRALAPRPVPFDSLSVGRRCPRCLEAGWRALFVNFICLALGASNYYAQIKYTNTKSRDAQQKHTHTQKARTCHVSVCVCVCSGEVVGACGTPFPYTALYAILIILYNTVYKKYERKNQLN